MKRNIKLAYLLAFCYNALFWTGIWLLYYLKFTDYQGVGLIETTWLIASVIGEIPTGAIADLLGKKRTVFAAFLFQAIGQLVMGLAPGYSFLLLAVFIMTMGSTLHSGSFEALIYDSLKQAKQEGKYPQVLANTQTISLVAIGLSSIIGGYVYLLNPRTPFFFTAAFFFFGLIISLFLTEPKIDTAKFTLKTYLLQTKQGFNQLFKPAIKTKVLSLLIISSLMVIPYQFLTDALLVEFGFKPGQLGVLYAAIMLFAAFVTQLTPKLTGRFGSAKTFYLVNILYGLILLPSFLMGMISGALSVFLRISLYQISKNIVSQSINKVTESRYRATSLSTFTMIQTLPYALTAVLIGRIMDIYSGKIFASYFGLMLIAISLLLYLNFTRHKTRLQLAK